VLLALGSVLVSDSRLNGSSASSLGSPVIDKEIMRLVGNFHKLESSILLSSSALTMLVEGTRRSSLPVKILVPFAARGSLPIQVAEQSQYGHQPANTGSSTEPPLTLRC